MNGNVGIGTTGPGYKLEVSGDAKIEGTLIGGSATSSLGTLSNNVVYQNTRSRKILVVAWFGAVSSARDVVGYIDSTSPPTILVASEYGTSRYSITFVVPPGWYYKVNDPQGNLQRAEIWEL